jgi:pimeloyl-ACP methyl ester carboxylesterase
MARSQAPARGRLAEKRARAVLRLIEQTSQIKLCQSPSLMFMIESILIESNPRPRLNLFWAALLAITVLANSSQGQSALKFIPNLADLQSCAGRYQASTDTVMTVQSDGDRLNLAVNAGSPMEFIPEAKDRFIHEQSGTRIHFVRDDRDHVTELVLERNGEHRAKRVADTSEASDILASERVRHAQVDGRMFRAVLSGDGKIPVVFVSGIANWIKVAAGIRGQASAVRYEKSGSHSEAQAPTDVLTQVRLLHGLLASLEVAQPFILVGWSYDGAVARLYADAYPEEVGGLVLVDPLDEGFVDWLQANQPKNYQLFRQRGTERYVADWDDFIRRLRAAHVPTSVPVVLLTAGNREIREGDALEEHLDSADFRQGNKAVKQAHEGWIEKIPGGRLVVVPNAGHDIPGEQPDYVVQAIQGELQEMVKRDK